jgi:hypothetical protein
VNDPYPLFGIAAGAVYAAYLIFGAASLATLLYCVRVAGRALRPAVGALA